jgi:hypothetical protein
MPARPEPACGRLLGTTRRDVARRSRPGCRGRSCDRRVDTLGCGRRRVPATRPRTPLRPRPARQALGVRLLRQRLRRLRPSSRTRTRPCSRHSTGTPWSPWRLTGPPRSPARTLPPPDATRDDHPLGLDRRVRRLVRAHGVLAAAVRAPHLESPHGWDPRRFPCGPTTRTWRGFATMNTARAARSAVEASPAMCPVAPNGVRFG